MPVFSHSRISCYETCPMQYRLRYVDQVDVDRRVSVESFLGHRVHETLQHLHEQCSAGVIPNLQELLTHLGNCWDREWHDQVQIVRKDTSPLDYRRMADRYVTNYYRANHPFDQGQTVATEMAVVFALDAGRDVHIRGYIDRLSRVGPGSYEIHDYKTSRRLPSQATCDKDRQLGLYHIALNQMMPDAEHVKLVWHYLAHNRVFQSLRTPESLNRLRHETLAAIDRIEEAATRADFPANRSRLCDWCEYRPVCPAWNAVQVSFTFAAAEGGRLDDSEVPR